MIVHALTQGVGCASRQARCVASTSTQWSPQHRLHCCVILSATRRTAPTPRPGGACAALLRSRCHRTHRRHLRQCLPRTARPPACWPHRSFVQRCVPCTPRASGAHYAPLLAVAVRTAPASGRSAMQAPRRPWAEQPRHIDLRSCENPTSSPAGRPGGPRRGPRVRLVIRTILERPTSRRGRRHSCTRVIGRERGSTACAVRSAERPPAVAG